MSEPVNPYRRIAVITGVVVLLHLAALWALQSGLLRRAHEVVVPVQVLSVRIAPQVSQAQPPGSPAARERPVVAQVAAAAAPQAGPTLAPSTQSTAISDAPPAPAHAPAPPGGLVAAQTAPSVVPVAVSANTGPAQAAPAAPKVELPSKDADYLINPKPRYPSLSVRLNEQGRVLVRVFIGADGLAQLAEIKASSGFERLDRAAMASVMQWSYVPGKVGGVAHAMWYVVPVDFFLE